ncbi:tryptophan--tRNA ligase [Ruminococcaceae bacterium OttesenSCG-928-N02]|nr:tryptophan--tRNA ligase [Ruminococcaceae bacterium OttesenSCG-928-N02]
MIFVEQKKRIFSGIQPSGSFTLGNYLGALRNWSDLQKAYECIYCVVDMHAITVRQDPQTLRRRTRESAAMLLAVGIDPAQSILFTQSHVSAHAELAWVLGCYTQFGELSRMTQFKDKSATHADNINSGLFTYPALMAADILVYNADLVPVGDDQRQHVELTRDIAGRFNGVYGETFVVPEGYIPQVGARVMSLQDPARKMSKSDSNPGAYILMLDEPDTIIKKFKRAVTDSENIIRYDPQAKPGVSNLLSIYAAVTGKAPQELEKDFAGCGYGELKTTVGEAVAEMLAPIQQAYNAYLQDTTALDKVLREGAQRAREIANPILNTVYEKVGFLQL